MFYKYILNEDKTITEEHLDEYDGVLNEVIDGVLVSETERFDEEVKLLFELFKEV